MRQTSGELKALETKLQGKKKLQRQVLAYAQTKAARDGLRAQKSEKARHFLLNVHKPLHSVLFRGGYLGSGNLQAVFYGAWGIGGSGWRFGCSGGVLL